MIYELPDSLSYEVGYAQQTTTLVEGIHMRLDPEAQVNYMLSPNVHGLYSCHSTISLPVS